MILSLDVSSKCTGWAIYDMEGLLVDYGSFRPASLLDFLDNISKLLLRDVSSVICEEIYLGPNRQTFKVLAKHQAIVELACLQHGIPLKLLSAIQWRKALGWPRLKRAEAKKKAIVTAEELYGMKVTEDEAEAVCLALAYIHEHV